MNTSFSAKKLLAKLGYASCIAGLASGLTFYTLHDAALEHKEVYSKGFAAGYAKAEKLVNAELPKTCTAWWFDGDTKQRYNQTVKSFCKGKR